MRFSPIYIGKLVIIPLRYFFTNYAGENLKYDEDPKKSFIEIGSTNDYNKEPIQVKPRVLIDRGSFEINKSGITDNLAKAGRDSLTNNRQDANLVFINGSVNIIIEARQEGTCEVICDMVMHFLVWSRPYIMDSQGFKMFAMPLRVGQITPSKEDREKFQVSIAVPYVMEESWQVNEDALKLNAFYQTLSNL